MFIKIGWYVLTFLRPFDVEFCFLSATLQFKIHALSAISIQNYDVSMFDIGAGDAFDWRVMLSKRIG